jgi:KDO2-lipid IV(A) lauroyltransferase
VKDNRMPADLVTGRQATFNIKYWAFRVAAVIVPAVPVRVSTPVARLAGLVMYLVSPGMRSRARHNLARIPGLGDVRARERTCRQAFQHLALNYLDLFRVRRADDAGIVAEYTVIHEELFQQAMARGKGLIIVTAHLGNLELALARIGLFGHPVIIPAERLQPERLFELSCALRTHHGVRVVPADRRESLRELQAALARNEIVLLAIDRDVLRTGVPMELFGEVTSIPTGGVLLARRTGASVLWASSWRVPGGRCMGGFESIEVPAVQEARSGDAREGSRAALRSVLRPQVDVIERKVAEHPEQWAAVFTEIWPQHVGMVSSQPRAAQSGAISAAR